MLSGAPAEIKTDIGDESAADNPCVLYQKKEPRVSQKYRGNSVKAMRKMKKDEKR